MFSINRMIKITAAGLATVAVVGFMANSMNSLRPIEEVGAIPASMLLSHKTPAPEVATLSNVEGVEAFKTILYASLDKANFNGVVEKGGNAIHVNSFSDDGQDINSTVFPNSKSFNPLEEFTVYIPAENQGDIAVHDDRRNVYAPSVSLNNAYMVSSLHKAKQCVESESFDPNVVEFFANKGVSYQCEGWRYFVYFETDNLVDAVQASKLDNSRSFSSVITYGS